MTLSNSNTPTIVTEDASKTISLDDTAKTIVGPEPEETPGTYQRNPSILDDDSDEIKLPTSTRRRTRPIFGNLGVSDRPWIKVNMGLQIITCECGKKDEINREAPFNDFLLQVDKFSTVHANCLIK